MSRVLFITQDLAIGGGTSSLSALFNAIKDKYETSIFLLANEGKAEVSYMDAIIFSNRLTDLYYRRYQNTPGTKKYVSLLVKLALKVLCLFNIDEYLAQSNKNKFKGFDCVISYGEGVATSFCQYIDIRPRSAWIHFEVSKKPFSNSFISLYDKFDHIVTVSDTIANKLREIYPTLAPKICGVHNIIDDQRIKALSEESIPEAFSGGIFNIISVGRISSVKRFSMIPEIARTIENKGYKIKWRILGPECDVEEMHNLISNIDKYEVQEEVEYYGNRTNPYPYIKQSDLLVILSSTEACPMVIAEARAIEVPIVATNFLTASEFIENGKDGIICPVEELSDEIIKLLDNRQHLAQIVAGSKNRGDDRSDAIIKFNAITL